jgi:hypothetical protein
MMLGRKKKLVINKIEATEQEKATDLHMAKQADDLIVIRQLKGKTSLTDIDLSDEEVNDVLPSGYDATKEEYTAKLKKIVQLTGYSVKEIDFLIE